MGAIIPLISLVLLVLGVLLLMMESIIGIILIVVGIILLISSIRIVTPNTVKTVEFLGRYNRILKPGLNLIIPVLEKTRHQDLFKKNFTLEVDGITSDNVTVYIGINIIFYVSDMGDYSKEGAIYKSVYSINDPRTMMSSNIDEQLRAMASTFTHKEIFGKREEIGKAIGDSLKDKLSEFGYKLDSIQVRNIKLDPSVMIAMNRVVESLKLKEAAQNEGEANKIIQIKNAEADKEAKILIGQGMAGQRREIAKGFKESVDLIMSSDESLNGDKILKFLLDSSRIETLGNIGTSDQTKVIYLNEDLEGRGSSKAGKLVAGSDIM